MSQRQSNLLWLRDLLEHLLDCQQKLTWSEDPAAVTVLTDAMVRDLERCQRICELLRRRVRVGPVV
jgi:hypothetical protein